MQFAELDKLLPIQSEKDLFSFWNAAFEFRKEHRDIERELAHYVFTNTLKYLAGIASDRELDDICSEFGALEAPGWPEDTTVEPEDYDEQLWVRLKDIVKKSYEKRTF